MIKRGKFNVLGVQISAVDAPFMIDRIVQAAHQQQPLTVTAAAVHAVMTGAMDPVQRFRLNQLDFVVPDGQPVRWGLNWLYHTSLRERVYGPDLMLRICERAAQEGLSIYFYGSKTTVLERLARNLQQRFPALCIAGWRPSAFKQVTPAEKQAIIEAIKADEPDMIFVGLGCPRQETWLYEHREHFRCPLIAVGAAFDFHAGTIPQAPPFMQRHGLEWVFRLMQEPRRLWKRYLLLNPLYLSLLLLQAAQLYTFTPDAAQPPADEARFG